MFQLADNTIMLMIVGSLAWGIATDAMRHNNMVGGPSHSRNRTDLKVDEALMALKTLIDRTIHSEVFTPAYPAFLQVCKVLLRLTRRADEKLCLASDRHVHGLALTSCRFTEVAPVSSLHRDRLVRSCQGTRYSDILAFYHHAGTIAAASGEYKRATELFTFVRLTRLISARDHAH